MPAILEWNACVIEGSNGDRIFGAALGDERLHAVASQQPGRGDAASARADHGDRKSTRLNSSHVAISYAVFCLKKKTIKHVTGIHTHSPTKAPRTKANVR